MIDRWARIRAALEAHGRLVRVSIAAVRGSAPREVGADMLIGPDLGFRGTIGGGALEWRALALAEAAFAEREPAATLHDVVLGPDLGQCCGGRVTILVECFDATDLDAVETLAAAEAAGPFATRAAFRDGRLERRIVPADAGPLGLRDDGSLVEHGGDDRRRLLLFGAGHVGRALVLALAPLPFVTDWIDTRDDAFPAAVPGNVRKIRLDDPVAAIRRAPAESFVLVASHDHAIDFAVAAAAIGRADLPWVGVIGSKTKRARFMGKFREMGHTDDVIRRMVMPVGACGPRSREPAVIAAAVAVDLLVADEEARVKRPRPVPVLARTSGVGA